MKRSEREKWEINITNLAAEIIDAGRKDIVDSTFKKYEATGFWNLNPSYYWNVFDELDIVANELRE
jgi:hypothetical protein